MRVQAIKGYPILLSCPYCIRTLAIKSRIMGVYTLGESVKPCLLCVCFDDAMHGRYAKLLCVCFDDAMRGRYAKLLCVCFDVAMNGRYA